MASCQSKLGSFNEQALVYAINDKQIDEQEYKALIGRIPELGDKGAKLFKNDSGEIDNTKVISYLLRYFKVNSVDLSKNDIWQPGRIESSQKLFDINVYLENSASMDGYVKGVTEFETAIYNLLGDIKISEFCGNLNLSYINKSIPYQKLNALPADIQDFIEKLEPTVFKRRGGDRSLSDFKNILNTVLKTVDDKNVGIVISDFVFSPGKNANAQEYLNNQSVGLKIDFAEKLKVFDLSAIVVQLQSNFDGWYYQEKIGGKPIQYKGRRPYYIWVLGSTEQINTIINTKILDNIKGGYLNRLVLQTIKETKEPNYKILYSPKIGSFSAKHLNAKIISDASVSKNNQNKGLFGFNVAVDFSNSLQDASYFSDYTNYVVSNTNYQLNVEVIKDKNDSSLLSFTHLIKLQTTDLREEVLKIDNVGKVPNWVYESTSIDDSNILTDKSEQYKTYGLKYLVEGVSEAFYPKSNSNAIYTIGITIKK